MNRRFAALLVVALGTVWLSSTVQAQPAAKEGTVIASGSESVRVPPTLLRLEVQLRGNGETAEKAVEQLKKRRKAAIARLKDLKAEETSIRYTNTALTRNSYPGYAPSGHSVPSIPGGYYTPPAGTTPEIGPPTLVPQTEPESTPPTVVPRATYYSGSAPTTPTRPTAEVGPPATTPPVAELGPPTSTPPSGTTRILGQIADSIPTTSNRSVTATTTLKAEWRLATADPDGIALAGDAIREKLIAARVFGDPDSGSMVPMLSPPTTYPPAPVDQPAPYFSFPTGGFTLSYVGTLDDAHRKAAFAAATAKARQRAAELAEAAGCGVGPVGSTMADINNEMMNHSTVLGPMSSVIVSPRNAENEIVSQSPELPEFTVCVTINFAPAPKNP